MARTLHLVIDGLPFAEGPRWRQGALYVSDMHGRRVLKIGEDGQCEVIVEIDDLTSGLGWLPDGQMLVVAMRGQTLRRRTPDGDIVVHADLSALAEHNLNDMVVGADGTAYVGGFGFELHPLGEPRPATLVRVSPDGGVTAAAGDLWFPNGIAMTEDGRTLIVAESFGFQLTAFDIESDGSLSGRRVWAPLNQPNAPDGICLDADGAAWAALPMQKQFVRVREGGEVLETIDVPRHALACVLGGSDRRTLFMTMSEELEGPNCLANPSAAVMSARVDVPGAGRP